MDPITMQVFFWLAAAVLATLIITVGVVGHRAAEAWSDRQVAQAKSHEALARAAEAEAKKAEMQYQKALLERAGALPPVSLTVPQPDIDRMALDTLRSRIASMHLQVEFDR